MPEHVIDGAERLVAVMLFKALFPLDTLSPSDELSPAAFTVPEAIKLTTFVAPTTVRPPLSNCKEKMALPEVGAREYF
jgi:hypothetical protein